jgi:hypothetical protein
MTSDHHAIGWAVKQMRDGAKVRRRCWPTGCFVVLMPALELPPYNTQGTERKVNDRTAKYIGEDAPLHCQPYFASYDGHHWQPGFVLPTPDLLAIDYEIAP